MFISVEGTRALEMCGAVQAADLIRRTECNPNGSPPWDALRNIVRTALIELDPMEFFQVIDKTRDAEAVYQAFVVMHEAARPPFEVRDVLRAVRNDIAFAVRERVWNNGIRIGLVCLIKAPVWQWQERRFVTRIRRYRHPWIRRYLVTFILRNAGRELLARARTSTGIFDGGELDRLQRDVRLGSIAA